MTSPASLVENLTAARKPLTALINKDCQPVGGIYRLDYDSAVVLTDDFKKKQAGGVPRGGFLLAAAGRATDTVFVLDEQEVILLRVRGTAGLPHEAELVQTRMAVVRDAGASGVSYDDVQDPLTRIELEQSAFDCEVLGTFYTETDDRTAAILFGADIDNVMASAKYQVFLPSPEVLSWLASYPVPENDSDRLTIGAVRFAATRRKAMLAGTDQSSVKIHVSDFVGRKTAVFGMTRTGKSNTIKTLVTAVHQYGSEHGEKIGQVIFDPQGEYANVQDQDKTGLRLLGDDADSVCIYKISPDRSDSREKPLRINFFDTAVLDLVWSLVQNQVLKGVSASAQYLAGFRTVPMDKPPANDPRAMAYHERYRLAAYALLHKAGIKGPLTDGTRNSISVTLNAVAADQALAAIDTLKKGYKAHIVEVSDSQTASDLLDWVSKHQADKWPDGPGSPKPKKAGDKLLQSWVDDGPFNDLLTGIYGGRGAAAAVKGIREFHSSAASGNVMDQVWDDMVQGRLSIIDLSAGNDEVAKIMSERIVLNLLNQASDRFRSGLLPIKMQVIVEEAHNLFERGGKQVSEDPWVRLSKEAAKYKMGLIYATQEVTSVDKRILSNTSNWLIAHLNSDHETKELSHYYDFAVWAPSIIKVEDVGFVRMKTYSGKYIVPVQVRMFDHAMVNSARQAAGLAPIDLETTTNGNLI
ncbi:ATP-binding protein [Nocardia araoensis]|uniref:ATP-binding protein n=1 Tax=Nocardia araoensis TaxID=228600 RepID=UPI00030A0D80|nr:DUF87 domain-containing protein [Nocardia araoensis]